MTAMIDRGAFAGSDEIVWKTTNQVINGVSKNDRLVHALRGTHTLCGLTRRVYTWFDVKDVNGAPRCADCASIPPGYATSRELTQLGLSYRQLYYWCQQGYLKPYTVSTGSGYPRSFSPAEIQVCATMARLVQSGIQPAAAHHAARHDGQLLRPDVRVVLDEP